MKKGLRSIRFGFGRSFILLFITLGALSCFGQTRKHQLSSIQDPIFEIIGFEELGLHKSSRTVRDTLSVIVVYVQTSQAQEPYISRFVPKIKSKLKGPKSFFVYFLDNRDAALKFTELLRRDEGDKEEEFDRTMKSAKALFVLLKQENKEFLRLFENGMTQRDFDALGLEDGN